jgi:hypothetical protein
MYLFLYLIFSFARLPSVLSFFSTRTLLAAALRNSQLASGDADWLSAANPQLI